MRASLNDVIAGLQVQDQAPHIAASADRTSAHRHQVRLDRYTRMRHTVGLSLPFVSRTTINWCGSHAV